MGEIDDTIYLFVKTPALLRTTLNLLSSTDGIHFKKGDFAVKITKKSGLSEHIGSCESFRLTSLTSPKDTFALTYIRRAKNKAPVLVIAHSKDLHNWKVKEELDAKDSFAALVLQKDDGKNILLRDGLFMNAEHLDERHAMRTLLFTSRHDKFDNEPLILLGAEITNVGILVMYDTSYYEGNNLCLQAGAALLDANNLKVSWRGDLPISQILIETVGDFTYQPLGATIKNKIIHMYWMVNDEIIISTLPSPFKDIEVWHPPHHHVPLFKKHHTNPIMIPHGKNEWESEGVFNPAAIYEDGSVHLLYRAIGPRGISVLGYASSKDGYSIDHRHHEPAYYPRERFEGANVAGPSSFTDLYASGGGWGGCEDPKLTTIGKKIYLTYVAFNGWGPPRLAISWIKKQDFLDKKWKWSQPQLMSRPGEVNKSGCILPEKINGKYVIFHRVFPDILIDFVDSLDFKDGKWLKGTYKISPRPLMWDSRKLSVGAPPIRTKAGWLVIYHAIDDRDDQKYKIGAMILDINDPTKVLHRSNAPLLVPDMHYENEGKAGVAYPCGAVIIGDMVHVYYGGGDKVVCVATAPTEDLLNHLINENPKPFPLKKAK